MVRNREEAVKAALESKTNKVGMCQNWTWNIFDSRAVGDRDGDGDADANDGWKSEPANKRHENRNYPAGVPVYFKNKSGNGHGHRAVSIEKGGKIRSIDISDDGSKYQAGNVGTATIAEIEKAMNLVYVGWSETISGQEIPDPPKAPEKPARPDVKNNKGQSQVEQGKEHLELALIRIKTQLRRINAQIAEAKHSGYGAREAELRLKRRKIVKRKQEIEAGLEALPGN